jgi:hypothetical protein
MNSCLPPYQRPDGVPRIGPSASLYAGARCIVVAFWALSVRSGRLRRSTGTPMHGSAYGLMRKPLLPRPRVTRGRGPTTSSRHLRPFAGKQHGAPADSSGDGTTPNVALNHPKIKTQSGPDTRGTSARGTGRYYEKAVRSSIRWGNSAVRDDIGCGDALGRLRPGRTICREAAEQRSSRAHRESPAKRSISQPTRLRHNLRTRLRRERRRGQVLQRIH